MKGKSARLGERCSMYHYMSGNNNNNNNNQHASTSPFLFGHCSGIQGFPRVLYARAVLGAI